MFKKQRNKFNNMNKYAREQFNSNLGDIVHNSADNSRSFWQLMGRLMGKQSNSDVIPSLLKPDNTYSFSDDGKANLLNDYFFLFPVLLILIFPFLYSLSEPMQF